MEKEKILKGGIFVLLFLIIVGNLIFLDLNFFSKKEQKETEKVFPVVKPVVKEEKREEREPTSCSAVCLQAINEATASIKLPIIKTTPSPVVTKEVFIPLGSGSTKAISWVDLFGIEAYVDPSKYSKIKEANFEVALRIPTANGRAYARLYNVNDNHPVWGSEVWSEGQSGLMVRSGNISFNSGNKLYRVQMYSTMGYEAFLDNARIRIVYE
ncbi:hypothetical protein HY946_02925 [Candidatus Gottesmanbacteria bacterium]|nr:hypothetical protein [Candidatus Gottesmanbacteria bacterium]